LVEFLTARHQQDYSWGRPNPRCAPFGLYLPHLAPAAPDRIAFVVDTSGSVPASALAAVTTELEEYLRLYSTATLDVLYAEAAVAGRAAYTAADLPLRLDPVGGGGTDFAPALAALAEEEIPPSCAVYLTDLEGAFPEEPPPSPSSGWFSAPASAARGAAPGFWWRDRCRPGCTESSGCRSRPAEPPSTREARR
jgi:predicted metal-dependent peptidase